MKYVLLALLLFTLPATAQDVAVDENEGKALKLATPSFVKKHIKVIAGDAMEGRETGMPGHQKAAEYLRDHFKKMGLASLVEDGTYFQRFDVVQAPSGAGCFVAWKRGRKKKRYDGSPRGREFAVLPDSGSGEVTAPVVFAGYGITAPEREYDDYAQLNVKKKIVLIMRGQPRLGEKDGWDSGKATSHATFKAKYDNAVSHGAVGLIVFSGPNYDADRRRPQPARRGRATQAPPLEKDTDDIPAVWVDYDIAAAMAGGSKKILSWHKKIDKAMKPASKVVPQLKATLSVAAGGRRKTQNVAAFLKGSDPQLAQEFIVLGAHYDHVGLLPDGKDRINNGADDNGSGTVALMTIAKMLGDGKLEPRRSIVLLAFSGEEMGLLGSKYYVEHPLRPIENTVAMLNMDMVGRNYDSGCEVIGTQFSPDLRRVIDTHRKSLKLKVIFKPGTGPENILERSDQGPFYKRGVPVAFFTTGLHKDYHKPSDHWQLIKTKNLAKIAKLITVTAMRVANADARPAFKQP